MSTETPELQETPDLTGAYPRLPQAQVESLAQFGTRRPTEVGDVLFRQGEDATDFFVVLAGKVATVEDFDDAEERVIAVHGPGRFLGELSLLTGQVAFYTGVVKEPGEVLQVAVEKLRELVGKDPSIGDLILRAMLIRRSILIGLGTGFRIVGSRYSPDARRLREFAARNRLPHTWIDLEEDMQAEALLNRLGITPADTPVVIVREEKVLRNPSSAELARALGLSRPSLREAVADLIVVGAGPAGLAASVYGASDGLSTLLLDAIAVGGQAGTSPRIENYLGFPSGVSGSELAERATVQAQKFGVDITVPGNAVELASHDGDQVIYLDDGTTLTARAVVIATGAHYCRLPIEGIEDYEASSVYYAATIMEARMCRDDPVAVVGGGNSAAQAVLFLAGQASSTRLLIAHEDLARDMSRYLADAIERDPRIEVMRTTEVRELEGGGRLERIVVENTRTGERFALDCRALFVLIGAEPITDWLGDHLELDGRGYIRTGYDVSRRKTGIPLMLETSVPGVFAAGDVRLGSTKRASAAIGEGAMSVRLVHERLAAH